MRWKKTHDIILRANLYVDLPLMTLYLLSDVEDIDTSENNSQTFLNRWYSLSLWLDKRLQVRFRSESLERRVFA